MSEALEYVWQGYAPSEELDRYPIFIPSELAPIDSVPFD